MRIRVVAAVSGLAFAGALIAGPGWSDEEVEVEKVEFTQEFLTDPDVVQAGFAVWDEQCQHCHGSKAYPGKAPKLKPHNYTPDFVFYRVTKGFKGMPSWKDVYTLEERMAVVAYVLSPDFSP